jgi:hypothetical protein
MTVQVCCGELSSQHAVQWLRQMPHKLAWAELAASAASTTAISDTGNILFIACLLKSTLIGLAKGLVYSA